MTPLADRIRPQKISDIVGQEHILGADKLLFQAIKSKKLFSMIFWGPPGVGKTTLARVIAQETGLEFLEFSAVNTSITELKKIFEEIKDKRHSERSEESLANARPDMKSEIPRIARNDNPPIIFIDEIHRFTKSQQDAFLPYVESGTIILIGATTENPSFEIISPLLSRSRVFVLNPLSKEELKGIVLKAMEDEESGLGKLKIKIEEDALDALLELSGGDARKALNALEVASSSVIARSEATKQSRLPRSARNDTKIITNDQVEEAYQRKMLSYDKAGEEHYNTISAFIKSMRASNPDAALYYLARMVEAGEDPLFIARRMVIFASEDIGQAVPTALVVANEVFRACETIGYPECQINLAHGVVYLSNCKKDRSSYEAYFKALDDVKKYGNLPIPMNLRNAPTKLMKELGYGKGYQKYTDHDLLPEKLKGKKYLSQKS